MFVDECQIHVKAGDGGAGAVSFRREAHVPRGARTAAMGGEAVTSGWRWTTMSLPFSPSRTTRTGAPPPAATVRARPNTAGTGRTWTCPSPSAP